MIWPITQIVPPVTKAFIICKNRLWVGVILLTYCSYSFFCFSSISTSIHERRGLLTFFAVFFGTARLFMDVVCAKA